MNKLRMNKLIQAALFAGLALLASAAFATPPKTINYQGQLTSAGAPVNGPVTMVFRLYATASGGPAALYTETQPVTVVNGGFNVVIGSVTPFALPFDVPYWLTVTVNADAEMTPRQPLTSIPYAMRASSLDDSATLPAASLTGGAAGQVLAGTAGAPAFTASPSLSGNLVLVDPSTATAGSIMKGGAPFIHNFMGAGGGQNTFIGINAGNFTLNGAQNTVVGDSAFSSATSGGFNTAIGQGALSANTSGGSNTAIGMEALFVNTIGSGNTATGWAALVQNQSGTNNVANGLQALSLNTTGFNNVAVGQFSLFGNVSGARNIGVGSQAGFSIKGNDNIAIGNAGDPADNGTIRIGTATPGGPAGPHTRTFIAGINGVTTGLPGIPVLVDINGQLGTISSSRRYKDDIEDMAAASEGLMQLRPVTFHYKADQNPAGKTLHYGLIAEEVAAVYPGLVAYSADGRVETVLYQNLPPMLLNEYQKQQRTIQAQAADLETQAAELTQQRDRIAGLEQALLAIKALLGTR